MVKPALSLITACSRPNLLPRIEFSISLGAKYMDITWYVIYDSLHTQAELRNFAPKSNCGFRYITGEVGEPTSIIGNAQNNYALEQITNPDEWVLFLSDDNTMHPAFYPGVVHAIEDHPHVNAIFYAQQVGPNAMRQVAPDRVKTEMIDLAQYTVKRSLIGDERMPLALYQSDGYLIEKLFAKPECVSLFLPKAMCYYNRLTWVG